MYGTELSGLKFFSPIFAVRSAKIESDPILIRKHWIRSSPDPQNFLKSSVQSSPDPPINVKTCILGRVCSASQGKITAGFILPLAKHDCWTQNRSSSAFASWGKIDTAFLAFQEFVKTVKSDNNYNFWYGQNNHIQTKKFFSLGSSHDLAKLGFSPDPFPSRPDPCSCWYVNSCCPP